MEFYKKTFWLSLTRHRIFANFAWLLTGNVAFKVLGMISTVYLARVLTDKGFGLFIFAQTLLQFPLILTDSGLGTLGIREIARFSGRDSMPDQISNKIMELLSLRLVLATVLLPILLVIIISLDRPWLDKLLFIGVSLGLIAQALNSEWVFQGMEKMKYLSLSMFLHQATFLILAVLLIRNVQGLVVVPILRFITDLIIGMIFLGILFSLYFKGTKIKFQLHLDRWWYYLKQAVPMAGSLVVIQASYNVDTILLGFLVPSEVVGWYNAAYRLVFLVLSLAVLITNAFAPSFSRLSSEDSASTVKIVNTFSWILHTIGFVSFVVLIVFSKTIVLKLYGPTYANAAPALSLLSISGLFAILCTIYLQPLLYSGHQKLYFYAVLFGCVANVSLNAVLIPLWSYKGACIATIVSNFIIYLSGYFFFFRTYRLGGTIVLKEACRNLAFSLPVLAFAFLTEGRVF